MRDSHIKKSILVLALMLMCAALVFCACGKGQSSNNSNNSAPSGSNTVPSGGDAPSNTDNTAPVITEDELYNRLAAICDAAVAKRSGSIDVFRNYKSTTVIAENGNSVVNRGSDKSQTDYYTSDDGKVSMIRLYYDENEHPFAGTLQKDGIRYSFTRQDMEDNTVLWKEGPAEADCYTLPFPESLLGELPDRYLVKKISFDGSVYTLELSGNVSEVISSNDLEASERTLSDVVAKYTIGSDRSLASCEWVYVETVKEENNTRTTSMDILAEFNTMRQPKDLDWFAANTTYKRHVYADVTADWYSCYVNIPGKIIYDVHIPKIKDDLPGAAEINKTIGDDFGYELAQTEESLAREELEEYISYHTDYAVYRFGNHYEIIVTTTYGSAYGSGSVSAMKRYVYDAASGEQSDPEAFLEKMGYTKEKFLQDAYDMDEYTYILGMHITDVYSYEDLLMRYWFDQDGALRFIVDSGY